MAFGKKHLKRIILTLLLTVGVLAAFFRFIKDNSRRIAGQNEEYLNELTTQRAISIDSLIRENLSFIKSTAYLYGKNLTSASADVAAIKDYEENSIFDYLRFIDAVGDDYTSEGVMANLADRDYFKAGMRGESGVTYVRSRVTGEMQMGFFAPVSYDSKVIGVMVGFYGETYISRLLDYELFGYEGEGWLCDRDGTVLGTTSDCECENYLDHMQKYDRMNASDATVIQQAFENGEDQAYTYKEEEGTVTGFAVALKNTRWILIRTFPASASKQILSNANREGVLLIIELIAMFAVYSAVLLIDAALERKRMREANRNANDVSTGVSRLFEKFATLDFDTDTYSYIVGDPDDHRLPAEGSYEAFCRSLVNRIPEGEDEHRRDVEAFLDKDNVLDLLRTSDRTSIRVHTPVGDEEWFTLNFIVIDRQDGEPKRLLVARQDVTALYYKEQEEQQRLQQAYEAAERASRAKTKFLFNMSHDLRTPMNAIIGYTELARREGVTASEVSSYVHKIDSSSRHLLALINDILEMSRIESGKLTLEPAPTDLKEVMDEAEEMFATQMAGKKISFTVDSKAVTDRWVMCDKHRLNRIILNLISNAYKFTPEGGSVSVTLVQTGAGETGGIYKLHVKDTGIGMSPDFVTKLFKPFEQERTSTVSGIQGTGLGLSITKNIVDLMGGQVEVQTEQGRGTEFIVTLPFPAAEVGEEAGAEPVNEETPLDFSATRLLLVEDNEINREIAAMILSQAGFMLDTAENGRIAVEKVAAADAGYYDAVLMDIQMPVMDGYSATKAIRAMDDPVRAGVPIIAMTANAFVEDVKASQAAGMNGHIAKPLDVSKMMEELTRVLGERRV